MHRISWSSTISIHPGRPLLLIGIVVLLLATATGQNTKASTEGIENGNYNYQGSFEAGYRFVDSRGSDAVYDTFVNLQQGPRLLEQTLTMHSLNHQGLLFDNLFFNGFGWGGDPENASRLRMSKDKWYNFNMTFRRDRNNWDYNLLANPLNPVNTVISVNDTPHQFETTRRMYDFNLTLMPVSPVRLRLGYSRNSMSGPSFSTIHEGTDATVYQNWRTLLDAYQFGVDFKVLPRTNISYDQFVQYYRGDTTWQQQTFGFQLSNGVPVSLGVVYNTPAGQPCAIPVLSTGFVNPACNAYLGYARSAPTRSSYPTEQLTLQSNYFPKLDISARASYSSSDTTLDSLEGFAGLITRNRQRSILTAGSASSKRVVTNTDLGVTIHVTESFRIVDSFRFSNFRVPGGWSLLTGSLFGATLLSRPNQFNPATCPPPFTAATCPQHLASSPADIVNDLFGSFLREESKLNIFQLEYDLGRHFTVHGGHRFERRSITNNFVDLQQLTIYPTQAIARGCPTPAGCNKTVTLTSANTLEINGHSLLAGFTARPIDGLRGSFDLEWFSADRTSTRISPKNLQHYKARISYKPRHWMSVAGTFNILESRNNVPEVLHRDHNRNYGFTLAMNPKARFGWESGYNYNDVYSTTNICYVATPAPAGATSCGAPFLQGNSLYDSQVHFGYTTFMFKPVPRVTANVGYNLTSADGRTFYLGPLPSTLGPLAFTYHQPTAGLDVSLARGWTWRTAWGYFGYNEKSDPGLVLSRDFHSNSATLSLRYAF